MKAKLRFPKAVIVMLALLAALAAPSIVNAGGWVVITLDQLPAELVAGQPYTVGMMARQHGRTPWQVEGLLIEAKHIETGQTVTFTASPAGQPGHYQAELLLPSAGSWEWGIASGLYPDLQPMPPLQVASPPQTAGAAANQPEPDPAVPPGVPGYLLAILGSIVIAAGLVLIARGRGRRFPGLVGTGLIILGAVLAASYFIFTEAQAEKLAPVPVTAGAGAAGSEPAGVKPASAVAIGQQLFLAKGCVVCHTNDRAIKGSEEYGISFGPNLTTYRNDPDFLHRFLKDPQSVRANIEMPNLELKLVEIEALIAFINETETQ